jgi:2-methylaconitate cis-trans-isomerase PrpF
VGQEKVDMTGNCGNMASGVAAFALEEGLVVAAPGQMEVSISTLIKGFVNLTTENMNTDVLLLCVQISVRIFNTNTKSTLVETIQLDGNGHFLEEGDYHIGGVKGTGSKIKVSFIKPGGSMTGKTFPTGNRQDELVIRPSNSCSPLTEPFTVRATLIDVSNPFIFVDSSSLPPEYHATGPDPELSLRIIEAIRREASVRFGFANDPETAGLRKGTPKIAIVSTPVVCNPSIINGGTPDITVLAYSMGKVHPSVQLTGAVCLGAAATLDGTVVERLRLSKSRVAPFDRVVTACDEQASDGKNGGCIVIGHSSGTIDVDVDVTEDDEVESVTVFRTARRVFEGTIFVSA